MSDETFVSVKVTPRGSRVVLVELPGDTYLLSVLTCRARVGPLSSGNESPLERTIELCLSASSLRAVGQVIGDWETRRRKMDV